MSFERSLWADVEPYLKSRLATGQFNGNDAAILSGIVRSERDSQLAQFCKTNLKEIVKQSQSNEQELALQRGQTERTVAVGQMLSMIVEASKQCDAVKGKDDAESAALRTACRQRVDTLTSLAVRNALPGNAPTPIN
jgi:methyl coenzyme M reductase gamma subunit